MELGFLISCHVSPVDPVATNLYSSSSKPVGYTELKVLMLPNVHIYVYLWLDDEFFGLWDHLIDILYFWLFIPQWLHFLSICLGGYCSCLPFLQCQSLSFLILSLITYVRHQCGCTWPDRHFYTFWSRLFLYFRSCFKWRNGKYILNT